jgi:hypothetical protein
MINPKNSFTGLMNEQHETHRLNNLFFKKVDSAYYLPTYGLDWDLWLSQRIEVSTGSWSSYFTQEATLNGIVILDQFAKIEDFSLKVTIQLLSEKVLLIK